MSKLKLEGPEGAQKISLMEKHHVDDWVDKVLNRYDLRQTEEQAQEKAAAAWFWVFGASQTVQPAFLTMFSVKCLPTLTCQYQGQLHRVTGSSRLGDVWLTEDLSRSEGYTKRVSIADCSDWKIVRELVNLEDILSPEEQP
jgi:hypothetical protein